MTQSFTITIGKVHLRTTVSLVANPPHRRKIRMRLPRFAKPPLRAIEAVSKSSGGKPTFPGLIGGWFAKQIFNAKFTGSVSDPVERRVRLRLPRGSQAGMVCRERRSKPEFC